MSRSDQRGVTLVLTALLMTVLMTVAAIVVDLGLQRTTRRNSQAVADLAARSAGERLNWGDPEGACQRAFQSIRQNVADFPAVTVDCSPLGSVAACNDDAPVPHEATLSGSTGPYTLRIRYPVPASEIAGSNFQNGPDDGLPCQRMSVVLMRENQTLFAPVINVRSLAAGGRTVFRQEAISQLVPALWILDPHGCMGLTVSGGSQVTVGTVVPQLVPGVITLDSDGTSCTGSQKIVDVGGTGSLLRAIPTSGFPRGVIQVAAMAPGQTTCAGTGAGSHACEVADVSAGILAPQPQRLSPRVTRAPVDWRYNCKAAYPSYHGIPIGACPKADTSTALVDALRAAVGTQPGAGTPSGFQRWTAAGHACNPAGAVTVTGNWHVDCPGGLTIGNLTTVTFASGNVVFDGDITMTGGTLTVNGPTNLGAVGPACQTQVCANASSAGAAFIFLRNGGDINVTGGAPVFNNALVYQEGGYVKIAGGAPPVWTSPIEGPFSGLSLWSELSSNKFQMNGGASLLVSGTFFTPEAAPFTLSGGAPTNQQHAQFVSYQLTISGGAVLTMAPDPVRQVSVPPKSASVIR